MISCYTHLLNDVQVAIKKIVDGCSGWVWRDKLCLYLEEWFVDML